MSLLESIEAHLARYARVAHHLLGRVAQASIAVELTDVGNLSEVRLVVHSDKELIVGDKPADILLNDRQKVLGMSVVVVVPAFALGLERIEIALGHKLPDKLFGLLGRWFVLIGHHGLQ